jgi:hypothetical protein
LLHRSIDSLDMLMEIWCNMMILLVNLLLVFLPSLRRYVEKHATERFEWCHIHFNRNFYSLEPLF